MSRASLRQAWVRRNAATIEDTYRRLHELAEASWAEVETTAFVCEALEKTGVHYRTFDGHTGAVATWVGDEDGSTVCLRADLDALLQHVEGEYRPNHSCGHDAHTAMVLHTLGLLVETGFAPKGTLKLLFQPAEETGAGARALIREGVVDDVDYLLGVHLRPEQELSFGQASPAIYHGATLQLRGAVEGEQAHAARPNQGVNVADSLAAVVSAVNSVRGDPTAATSAKVTRLEAGTDSLNVIPDQGIFGIDVRARTSAELRKLEERLVSAIELAGKANGAGVHSEILTRLVASRPAPLMEGVVSEAIVECLGERGLRPPPVTPGGEDFHFYTEERPEIQGTMLGLGAALRPGLHHPEMAFEPAALGVGVHILAASIERLFSADAAGKDKEGTN